MESNLQSALQEYQRFARRRLESAEKFGSDEELVVLRAAIEMGNQRLSIALKQAEEKPEADS